MIVRANAIGAARRLAAAAMIACLALSLACSKKTPQQKAQEVEDFMRKGDTLSAIIKGRDFLKEHPDLPESYRVMMVLAQCSVQERDYRETHKYLQKVLDKYGLMDPMGFSAYVGQADTKFAEGKTTDAIQMLSEALPKFDPVTTETVEPRTLLQGKLAGFQLSLGNYEAATDILQRMFDEATDVRQGMDIVFARSQAALGHQKPADLRSAFDALLVKWPDAEAQVSDPTMISFIEALVGGLASKKLYDDAIGLYRDYLDKRPDSPSKAKVMVGIAYYLDAAGRKDESEAQYAEALALLDGQIEKAAGATDKGRLILEKSRIYELRGQFPKALELCKGYMEQYPASEMYGTFFQNCLGIHVRQNDLDAAFALAAEIEKKFADQPLGQMAKQATAQLRDFKAKQEQAVAAEAARAAQAAAMTTGTAVTSPSLANQ